MKKVSIVALGLAVLMLFSLVGCVATSDGDNHTTTTDPHAGHNHATTTDPHAGHNHTTTTDPHAGHNHATTTDPHEGHNHTTTTGEAVIPSKFDEVVSLTTEHKIPAGSKVYRDSTVKETNYTLKLTAEADLIAVQLISIDPDTGKTGSILHSLSPLAKGESQYLQLYVNDAVATRGIICTDASGKRWHYALMYSGASGRVTLGYFHA